MLATAADRVQQVSIALIWRGPLILVSRRMACSHLGGCWEFPGGRLERGESALGALRRELDEELGIDAGQLELYRTLNHRYERLTVTISVWKVTAYTGRPYGREGQLLCWMLPAALLKTNIPAANRVLVAELADAAGSQHCEGSGDAEPVPGP